MNYLKKYLLLAALTVSILTYVFWSFMPKGFFYIGNALFIVMLSGHIYINNRKSFIVFCIFILSVSNLMDELLFDNTKLGWNELILALTLPIFWHIKNNKYDRPKDN